MELVQISNEDYFLRRVPTIPSYIKQDGSISSLSFKSKRGADGLSGDAESLIKSYEDAILRQQNKYRLLKLNVGVIRNKINDGLDVIHNPIANDPDPNVPDNPAHCLIIGNITDSKAKQLLQNSEEIIFNN